MIAFRNTDLTLSTRGQVYPNVTSSIKVFTLRVNNKGMLPENTVHKVTNATLFGTQGILILDISIDY